MEAFLIAVLPEINSDNAKIRENVLNDLDRLLMGLSPILRLLYNLGLYLFQFGTIIFLTSILPFTWMRRAAQKKYIEGWNESRLRFRREMFLAYRGVAMLAFYSQPEVIKLINYDIESHLKERMGRTQKG